MNEDRVYFTLLFVFSFFIFQVQASTVITGNSGSSLTSFDFSVDPINFVSGSNNSIATVVIGAGEQKVGNTFSVAIYSSAVSQFIPVGVATITLNNQKDQSNPLTGQKIKFLSTNRDLHDAIQYFAIVDKDAQLERFYFFPTVTLANASEPTNTSVTLVQSDIPNDATGNAAAGDIVGLTSCNTGDATAQTIVLGAVTANGQAFGSGNSGIIAARANQEKTDYFLKMYDLSTGLLGNKAISFNGSLDALKVGSDVTFDTTVSPVIDMYWDNLLQRLYVAVCVNSAAGVTNGARAIVVGRFQNGILHFEKFIPDIAVTGSNNDIIVGANNGRAVSIYKVRVMHTSTGLPYLIVNGGNNAVAQTGIRKVANQVYAIPLVNLQLPTNHDWKTSAIHGTAAKTSVTPFDDYNEVNYRFRSRTLRTAASSSSDLFTTSSQEAQVGAGTVPLILPDAGDAATIKDMFVRGDSVYVSVAASYGYAAPQSQQPGLFQSQAIFDHLGKIAAWTPWKRVAGSDDRNYGAMVDALGNSWYLTGADDTHVNTVKRTEWGIGSADGLLGGTTSDSEVGLVSIISQQLPEATTGGASAMQVFDASNNVVGIPNSGLTGIVTLLVSGSKKFMLVKMGDNSEAAGTIKPYTGNFATNLASSTNGTFPAGSGRIFVVSGGALSQVGPITTNATFSNSSRSWIAVGGVNGLAILSDGNGQGFLPSSLPEGFTFKKAGNYRFVKKVVGDGHYLYVLTNRTLERITIDSSSFASGSLQRTIIARSTDLGLGSNASFFDLLICDKLALLATSKGLFRIANGSSVKVGVPAWSLVETRESAGPIFSLSFSASSNDLNTGLANRGQVFALSSYFGYDQARIYRFYIDEGSTVSDSSIRNISDLFVEDIPTYLASFGQMRSSYTDDGSVRLVTRPATCNRTMALMALSAITRVGVSMFTTGGNSLIDAAVGQNGSIGRVMRSAASGAWLLNGSFGLRVNE